MTSTWKTAQCRNSEKSFTTKHFISFISLFLREHLKDRFLFWRSKSPVGNLKEIVSLICNREKSHTMGKHVFFIIVMVNLGIRPFAQTFVPMPCTGYNLDGVAENTTAVSTTGGALDASDFVLYSQFYGTLYSTGFGLPNSGLMASGSRTYQLAAFTTSNTLHLFANGSDTLVFTNPQAFPVISLLCYGTQGNATASVTVRFTDNSTQVFNPLTMTDWFSVVGPVFSGFDRALRTTGVPALVGSNGNPRMMALDLPIACANQGKPVARIIVRNTSATAHVCIMAVSGQIPGYYISGNTLICSNGTSTLSASGLASYTWSAAGSFTGSNNGTITVNPNVTTVYTLSGTDALGCPGYSTIAVTVSSTTPVLSLAGTTQSVCLGAPATITASGALTYTLSSPAPNGVSFVPASTSVYSITGSNGCGAVTVTTAITVTPLSISATAANTLVCSGGATSLTAGGASNYTWMPGASNATILNTAPTSNTTYTLSGSTASCFATATIFIGTMPLPTLNIVASSTDICSGDQATLTVSGNALTYTWSPGNSNNTSITLSPLASTLYVVSATNSLNCMGTLQQVILVRQTPTVVLSASKYSVCPLGTSTLFAAGATNYTWSNNTNLNSLVLNPSATQVYSVTGSYTNQCSSTATLQVEVFNPTISVTSNTAICLGNSIVLTAGGANSYTWTNGNITFNPTTVTPSVSTIYTVNANINYTAAAVTCTASNTVQIMVNPMPSITAVSTRSSICKGEKVVLTGSSSSSPVTYVWAYGNVSVPGNTLAVFPVALQNYTVTGTDGNGCLGTAVLTVNVSGCTNIAKSGRPEAQISIYPNPSKGSFHIDGNQHATVSVFNAVGEIIRHCELNADNHFTDKIEGLDSGVYLVTTVAGGSSQSFRVVVSD
jgi:hypothetical protein